MNDVLIARSLFGSTMAFHIIFATLGVGLPLMMLAAEISYQITKDRDYSLMAMRWTKGFAILLGVGIPTGTIAAVQLTLLWPGFMAIVGQVIALPFQIEIFAFMLEALFMSIYVYAADRLSSGMRILSLALVGVGALASAVLITNVHSFESTPGGFRIVDGRLTDVHPWEAVWNTSFPVTASHVAVSAYVAGAFAITTVAAYKMLKAKKQSNEYRFHQKALIMSLVIGGIFALMTALNGHEAAQGLHRYNPEKLAAAEGLFQTQSRAPLVVGGIVDRESQTIKGGIEIPWALSFLAGNDFDTVVRGLNEWPENEWPPLFTHLLFDGMVASGSFLIVLAIIGYAWRKLLKRDTYPRWLMWLFVLSGPIAMLAIEFGWIFSCTGRQPWVIYRVMRTAEATTQTGNLGLLFLLFTGAYLFFGVITMLVMYFYFRRNPLILSDEADVSAS